VGGLVGELLDELAHRAVVQLCLPVHVGHAVGTSSSRGQQCWVGRYPGGRTANPPGIGSGRVRASVVIRVRDEEA
jgi:hypothetical protein